MRSSELRLVLERQLPPVYRFCLHLTRDPHLAEDLAQDTMLKAWNHRRRLRREQDARPWLFTIARNAWRDDRRRARVQKRSTRRLGEMISSPPEAVPQPDLDDQVQAALDAIEDLPDRQRDVLYLCVTEELSQQQVARVLDVSTGAVKASLSLARKRVRQQLEERGLGAEEVGATND